MVRDVGLNAPVGQDCSHRCQHKSDPLDVQPISNTSAKTRATVLPKALKQDGRNTCRRGCALVNDRYAISRGLEDVGWWWRGVGAGGWRSEEKGMEATSRSNLNIVSTPEGAPVAWSGATRRHGWQCYE